MRFGARAFRRFIRQPAERRRLFIEAWLRLGWARLLLQLMSFDRLTPHFSCPLEEKPISLAAREQLRRDVGWAVERAAEWLPGRTVCFPKAMAAQTMCRKRGIDSILFYGATVDPVEGLVAHVWVQDGANGVVGYIGTEQYGVLARFPAQM